MVAADEDVALRLGIGFDVHAASLGNLGGEIAEIGFGETEHHQRLQRNDGQEHVDIDVGDHRLGVDRRILREVFGAEQSFLFAGNENKEQ